MTVAGGHTDGYGSETVNKAMSESVRRVRDAPFVVRPRCGRHRARLCRKRAVAFGNRLSANRRIAFTVTASESD